MDENLLLLSSTDDGDDYLLFTANELKEKRIFLANFSLESFIDSQCKTVFRFCKEYLAILKQRLRIPDKIVCQARTVVSGIEALCILLRRLAYPNRLIESKTGDRSRSRNLRHPRVRFQLFSDEARRFLDLDLSSMFNYFSYTDIPPKFVFLSFAVKFC